jgi:putative acetyltransferase
VIAIAPAKPDELELVRTLFREYGDSLGVDLAFQDFERELAELPWEYAAILLGRVGGEVEGCVAVRPLEGDACELKRLYVRPAARGSGLGRALAEAAVARARLRGFAWMRLDTLPTMDAARALYRSLGFVEIEPYRFNPIPGTSFMELRL